ncbi:MAG: 23S rRNA (adenine(2503)-C(2))-methyltransferase RlmN [Mycoplasmatales bacterium]
MNNIYDLTYNQLEDVLLNNKIQKFRAKQIWNWLYVHLVEDFESMQNIDSKTIDFLKKKYYIPQIDIVKKEEARDGTIKLLLKLNEEDLIETVLLDQRYGKSVCVTTQVGCNIGCSFCASGLLGYKRNLSAGEIVLQIVAFSRILKEQRVSHVVVMGIGEPFKNYQNTISFIDIINNSDGLNIGARHITVSTSGIVNKIDEFATYDKQVNLAISLHAPNNKLRSSIMHINDVYNIESIILSVRNYIKLTNRRVSFEYIMLEGINDSKEVAYQLVKLLKGINCHVNLIPFNKVDELIYNGSSKETIDIFKQVLLDNNIQVTARQEHGSDINGACGQLRHKESN